MDYMPNSIFFHHRFNRYMVECEFAHGLLSAGATDVLIDTWWNVNM